MTSRTTIRRQLKKLVAKQETEQKVAEMISAADHYTARDRELAEEFECREHLAAFIAEEL
jgi:hypothetical protein